MSMGLEHLLNPLVGFDMLSAFLPLFGNLGEQNRLQNDPNILAFLNNRIDDYNAQNAYNPETGQYNAGSPYGDPASGFGGAFGHDSQGNPLSPMQAQTRDYAARRQNAQGNLDTAMAGFQGVADRYGLTSPQSFDLGIDPSGYDPTAVQGVDQSFRTPPTPMEHVAPQDDWFSQFLGSFAVGTSSVPRTGLAQVHQGEAIIPAEQNPNRLPPGVQGAAFAPEKTSMPAPPVFQPPTPVQTGFGGGAAPPRIPGRMDSFQPVNMPHGGQMVDSFEPLNMPQSMPQQNVLQPPPASAQQTVLSGTPPAPGMTTPPTGAAPAPLPAPAPAASNYLPLSPGLSPEVQQRIIDQGRDELSRQTAGIQRGIRDTAGGQSGVMGRRMFDAEIARSAEMADLIRNTGIEAANRQFTDSLAANQFELSKQLGLGGLGVQQGTLDLQRELGLGNLANSARGLDIQQALGERGLDIEQLLGQQGIDVQRELGLGNIQTEQRGQDIQQLLGQRGLDIEQLLGLGGLGIQQGGLDLQRQLGLGGLANEARGLDIQQLLGLGNIETEQRGQDIQQLLGQRGLDIEQLLGLGGLDLQRQLGLGSLANEARGLDIQQLLGLGNLELGQGRLALDELLGQGGLDLQRQLGLGGLANESRGLDIQQLLGERGLDLQNRGLDLEQFLGTGRLDLDLQRLANELNLGQQNINMQDAFNQGQLDLGNMAQSNQAQQFQDLLALLGQGFGQPASENNGSLIDSLVSGIGGFFNNLF